MADPELLHWYRRAVWAIDLTDATVELRLHPAAEVALPRPDGGPGRILPSGGIITAYNPASIARSELRNRRADELLRTRLRAAGAELHRTISRDPLNAGAWDEPGFLATGLSRSELVGIAGEFGQNAIVWIDPDGGASLVAVRPGFCGAAPGDLL